jgi:hypothetical protein
MDQIIIAGMAAYATELAKGYGLAKKFIALAVMFFTIIFSLIGAVIYAPATGQIAWQTVVQQAIVLGAMTSGIYGLGKAAKEQPPQSPFVDNTSPRGPPEVSL